MPERSTVPPPVPDHELIRCIGSGSYGQVWLARSALGALRAIKVIYRADFSSDRPFNREFEGIRKYEPISRTHPSQVAILQVGQRDEFFYYVMELADDVSTAAPVVDPETYEPHTLKSRTRQSLRLPLAECLRIGLGLTEALSHLHANGLVHRDVKPANIIFVRGQPKLADIGLVTDADASGTLVGTEGFLPPEGGGSASGDLFALGKVLYEISTGLDRQEYPTAPADLAVFQDRRGLLELEEIIDTACAADPRQRYRSAAEMHADLAALAQGRSVRRRHRWERWRRRARQVAWAAVVVVPLVTIAIRYRSSWPGAGGQPVGSRNPVAMQHYRVGQHHLDRRTPDGIAQAVGELKLAVAADPAFAGAHAALATAHSLMAYYEGGVTDGAWRAARDSAKRALELDPRQPDALLVLAIYERDQRLDLAEAERHCRAAMELAPQHARAHHLLSSVLGHRGDYAGSIAMARRAVELDPTSALLQANLGARLVYARRFEEAVVEYRRAIELQPNFHLPHLELSELLFYLGRDAEAFAELELEWRYSARPDAELRVLRDAMRLGGARELRNARLRLMESAVTEGKTENTFAMTLLFVAQGRLDEALETAGRCLTDRRRVFMLLGHPYFDRLREHPRFHEIVARARPVEP